MAGCIFSPLAFTMAMEAIIKGIKMGSRRRALGFWDATTTNQRYMDDMTTMTTTVACTNRFLGKLTDNIE